MIATPPPPETPQTLPLDLHPQLGNLPLRPPQAQHRNRCTDTNTDGQLRAALHALPARDTGRPRHTVQSCSAQAGRFLGIFPGRAAALCRPRLRQTCEKTARRRLHTPASATGAARTLSRRQCARRLPKNQGYKASPRSALSADGEANKGTRSADPPSRHRGRRRGLAQRPARHGRAQRPRKSGSPAGTRRHRGLCLGAGRHRPHATKPCLSACPGPRKFGSKI